MENNVLSWHKALAQGYQPGLYDFQEVSVGRYLARLDFKIWAKKVMAINCYFTQTDTGRKIQLTVYCNESGHYRLGSCAIDFLQTETGRVYQITVLAFQKRKTLLVDAALWP